MSNSALAHSGQLTRSPLRLPETEHAAFRIPHSALRTGLAFSLIELMITVGLLGFIVLGLLAMFNQTQRAFRSSMTQTDVLEAGRALTDLITRELEQMTPAQMPATNFLTELALPRRLDPSFEPALSFLDLPGNPPPSVPLQNRANFFHNFFFLTRENQRWTGIGYLLANPASGAATLYRFQADASGVYSNSPIIALKAQFDFAAFDLYKNNLVNTNYLRRIADGIVHLRVAAYDPNGALILPYDPIFYHTNIVLNSVVRTNFLAGREIEYTMFSNAVPAAVELEIGFLENKTLERMRSIPNSNAQLEYLRNHAAQVHLFRQRIPVRNVDFSAYP